MGPNHDGGTREGEKHSHKSGGLIGASVLDEFVRSVSGASRCVCPGYNPIAIPVAEKRDGKGSEIMIGSGWFSRHVMNARRMVKGS